MRSALIYLLVIFIFILPPFIFIAIRLIFMPVRFVYILIRLAFIERRNRNIAGWKTELKTKFVHGQHITAVISYSWFFLSCTIFFTQNYYLSRQYAVRWLRYRLIAAFQDQIQIFKQEICLFLHKVFLCLLLQILLILFCF